MKQSCAPKASSLRQFIFEQSALQGIVFQEFLYIYRKGSEKTWASFLSLSWTNSSNSKAAMPNYLVQSHLSIIKYAPMIFLLSIIFFLLLGWLYGRYRIRTSKDVIVRDSLATAIFGLSALVLGFTFSSANDHFNQRINTASLEAASIERVYKSTKYLRPADQALVQKS